MSFGFGMGFPRASSAAGGPSLNLQFAGATTLDPRITFTRASSASYYNSGGYLQIAAINLLTFSEQFNNVIWVKSRASITANAVNSPDGTLTGDKLVEDTTASNTHFVSQTVTNANAAYTYSVYVKAAERNVAFVGMTDGVTALSGAFIDLSTGVLTNSTGGSWTNFSSASTSVGNGWWRVSVTATRGAGTTTGCNIYPCLSAGSVTYTGDGTSGIYIWGAQLEVGAFPTTYTQTTSTATGAPRFDYNPSTLAPLGLLIEEQRTNLVTYSSEFDNAVWIKARVSIAANTVVAPDGALTGDKIVENLTLDTHVITRTISVSATSYTATVYAQAAGRDWIALQTFDGSVSPTAYFNVAAGTLGVSYGGASASITPTGNGWYRCSLTYTVISGVLTSFAVYLATGDNSPTYTGNGTSGVYLWGAQLEAGSFPTSYIPSTNTFTSRASTGTYYDSNGVLQSAAIDVARVNYNPANLTVQPSLLLEAAATNSIRNNTGVGAVAGTPGTPPTNCSFTGAATGLTRTLSIGSEDGIAYVDIKYVGTASGSTFSFFNTDSPSGIAAATGQTWNGSFYLKLVAGSTAGVDIKMSLLELNSGGSGVVQSLSPTLTPTAASLSTQRNTLTATLSGGATVTNLQQGLRLLFTNGPIDITLRIGLPQLELGAFATSVIPTTTAAATRAADLSTSAAATRAADNASMTGTNFSSWYNATEGTLFANVIVNSSSYGAGVTLDIGAGGAFGTTEYISWLGSQWSLNPNTAPINVSSLVTTTATAKVAAAIKANNSVISANGLIGVVDTACAIAASPTTLSIGKAGWTAGNYFNGTISSIAYYPRRLSNAELQSITA